MAELRKWWRNCAGESDEEIAAIDKLEDDIAPLGDETKHIRSLISQLEMCHHKVERHVELIIQAIGEGKADKTPGKRPIGEIHPREALTELVIGSLTAWINEEPYDVPAFGIGGIAVDDLFSFLGDRTPLKVWQVQQVCDKLRSFLDPEFRYYEMVEHPKQYADYAHYRGATINTVIHDTVDGEEAKLTLASAIDHLQPCNWNFPENLVIMLKAIGGDLYPKVPFAAHKRNVELNPIRKRIEIVSNTLRAFCEGQDTSQATALNILRTLGEKTPTKHWLAASLDKTIRLQMGL